MNNVLISCLEVSADHIAAHFIRFSLTHLPNQFNFFCIGGEEIKKITHPKVKFINDLTTLGNIGFIENLKHTLTYLKFTRWFSGFLNKNHIDIFLAVDGQGINIPLGQITKKKSIKNVYLFPPPVFTFGRGILKKMHVFDLILCPFKKDFLIYKKNGFNAYYTGHPYYYLFKNTLIKTPEIPSLLKLGQQFKPRRKLIALFPGSRLLEIKKHTRIILEVVEKLKKNKANFDFVISLSHQDYLGYIKDELKKKKLTIPIYHSASDYIIQNAYFIIATSGTTTLKASFVGTPHVIVYRLNWMTYFIYKLFKKINFFIYTAYIGTINVYLEKEVTPELMNKKFNPKNIITIIEKLHSSPDLYNTTKKELLNHSKEFINPKKTNPFEFMLELIKKAL